MLIENEKLGDSLYTLAKFIRVDKTVFDELLSIVEEDLKPNDPVRRDFLSAEHKLVVTLRYLATGESYESLQYGSVDHKACRTGLPENTELAVSMGADPGRISRKVEHAVVLWCD